MCVYVKYEYVHSPVIMKHLWVCKAHRMDPTHRPEREIFPCLFCSRTFGSACSLEPVDARHAQNTPGLMTRPGKKPFYGSMRRANLMALAGKGIYSCKS